MKGCEKMRLKRLLSLLISSAMTISVMPLTAFAAQEPPMPYGASANGYDNLELSAKKSNGSWEVEKSEEPENEDKKTVTLKAGKVGDEFYNEYYTLTPEGDKDYIQNIKGVYVNEIEWKKENSSSDLYGEDYCIENNSIMFKANVQSYLDVLENGDVIRITNPYYNDVELNVTIDKDGDFSVYDVNEGGGRGYTR